MKQSTVLVVEDDPSLRSVLSETLQLEGYPVVSTDNGEDALRILRNNKDIALLLSDVQMHPMGGHDLLKNCKEQYPALPFVLMTAYGTIEKAVQMIHDGAADYLTKPFEPEMLIDIISRYISPKNTALEDGFIAVDPNSVQLAEVAKRVALTDASVMISGESGVGKEVISRFIHENSSRSSGPFVAINCAAIPENMLESELFGYEKGAFTGAYKSKARSLKWILPYRQNYYAYYRNVKSNVSVAENPFHSMSEFYQPPIVIFIRPLPKASFVKTFFIV